MSSSFRPPPSNDVARLVKWRLQRGKIEKKLIRISIATSPICTRYYNVCMLFEHIKL